MQFHERSMIWNSTGRAKRRRRSGSIGLFLALLVVFGGAAIASPNAYTQAMFQRALAKDNPAVAPSRVSKTTGKPNNAIRIFYSTTPLYVLITLRDPKTGATRQVCTLGTYLMGAIAEEYHLDVF